MMWSWYPSAFLLICIFSVSATTGLSSPLTTDPVLTSPTGTPSRQYPVFFLHGINDNSHQFRYYESNLTAEGIVVIGINTSSFADLWTQAYDIVETIQSILSTYDNGSTTNPFHDGFHLLGFSQGGLLARAVVEIMPPEVHIRKLISIAGPQMGIYLDSYASKDLEAYFAHLPKALRKMLLWLESRLVSVERMMTYVAYHPRFGQHLSLGNLWHLPWIAQRQVFLAKNPFLPIVNNVELEPPEKSEQARRGTVESRRAGVLRLESAHFFCSQADQVIVPQASCGFEFYDPRGENTQAGIRPLAESEWYQRDSFGLKSLDESGRLDIRWIDGVCHDCWLDWSLASETDTQQVYADHIYPLLVNGETKIPGF